MNNLVSAVFDNYAEAETAVAELRACGVRDSALSVIAQHDGRNTTADGSGTVIDDGDSNGLVKGLVAGAGVGAVLGIAALAIPGVGPLVAAGAIAGSAIPEAAAIGAAVGATTGGVTGLLTKHGVSDEDARYYGDRINSGGVFVSVDTSDTDVSADAARNVLYRHGGHSSTQARTVGNEGLGDKVANTLDGRDDPNRGPVDRLANALDGHDDPNRGPVDRLENAIDRR